jgi:tetratricopeptide (TPR) repeat protein
VERLREGGRLARDGRIVEAVDAYREAREMDPQLMVSSGQLNTLCWYGALWEHAADVMDACEEAVALSPNSANIRDSRGVARALTGDLDGAIADLSLFVERTENAEARAQRRAWIEALEAGQNPLTTEVLASLRGRCSGAAEPCEPAGSRAQLLSRSVSHRATSRAPFQFSGLKQVLGFRSNPMSKCCI